MRLPNKCAATLRTTALAVRSYLEDRMARAKPTFVTPPPDSMGP
jgi:hypothetical protein